MRQRGHHFCRAVLCRQQRFKQRLRLTVHAGGSVIFRQLVIDRALLRFGELRMVAQLLVQVQGAIQFAAFAKETAEGKLVFQHLLIQIGHVDEDVHRAVGLVIQQKAHALEIRGAGLVRTQIACFLAHCQPPTRPGGKRQQQDDEPVSHQAAVSRSAWNSA